MESSTENKLNILIRDASPDDAEQLLAVYRPYVTDTAVTFEYDIPDTEAFRPILSELKECCTNATIETDYEWSEP